MAKVTEVEVGARVGGKVQVKKYDINAEYEFSASQRLTLEDGDDPDQVIEETRDHLYGKLLEPKGQEEFEILWRQRLQDEERKRLGDAR